MSSEPITDQRFRPSGDYARSSPTRVRPTPHRSGYGHHYSEPGGTEIETDGAFIGSTSTAKKREL
jgi:hypothetical protein